MSKQRTKEEEAVSPATQEIPVLSVDESLSVEQRFTDNAIDNILPARYLVKDEDGEVTEEPHELFERVADNVATAEFQFADEQGVPTHEAQEIFGEWRDEFEELMKTQRFMPNSPTLMNAGARLQQLSACISGDTPIYTEDGLKRMDEIQEGDKVLTHTGSFKEVTAHWSNGIKDTLDVKRGTSHGSNYSVTATHDHEFLSTDDEWVELQELDQARQPHIDPDIEPPESFDLTKHTSLMNKDKPVVSDGGKLLVKNSDDPRTAEYDQQYSEVVASVDNCETFAYLAGAYLAEGDVDSTDLRFTIGADEDSFCQRITESLSELFDIHVARTESNYGSWQTVTASSPFVADLFLSQFGTGSTEKRIPNWVFATHESYQEAILQGLLDGDAYEEEGGWKLTLANPTLAYQASLLARNVGYHANFTLDAENELSANDTSRVRISKDSDRLQSVDTRVGDVTEVYDMEVADDHSFVAGDFVVHNCFVDSPSDDLEDIAETEKEWTLVQKTGGGMGADFSALRPKGTIISTTKGTSSGPVSFMKHKFNNVAGVIKQGGVRRGAQMAELRVDHPDIGRFAVAKREEGALDNFNISASVTDEFIEAVENDEMYTLYAPQSDFSEPFEIVQATKEFYAPSYQDAPKGVGPGCVETNIWRDYADEMEAWDWDESETVSFRDKWERQFDLAEDAGNLDVGETMELPARFIWDIILDGAWRNGEPGLFHLDETRRKHSFDGEEHEKYQIYGTNPCVTAGTMVATPRGPERVENIDIGDEISTTRGSETVDDVLSFDDQTVYTVKLSDGGEMEVTADHRFHVLDGKQVSDKPLRDIEEGDYIRLHPATVDNEGTETQYKRQLRRGILVGDGCYTEDTIKHNNSLSISTSEADEAYNERLVSLFEDAGYTVTADRSGGGKSMKYWLTPADEIIEEHALDPAKSHEKSVDVSQFETEAQIIGFLDGLLASDGNINLSTNRPQLRWTSSSDDLVQNVRTLALNIGAHARIYEDQRKERVGRRNDGSKILGERKVSDVHIAGESLRAYASKSRVDEIHPEKGSLLREAQDSWALTGGSWKAKVESIEESNTAETVYDLYCSDSDTWITEGYVQRGCAEQPLCEYEACNLGHINLSLMVRDGAPTYDEWVESTDYDYDTKSAEAYDYFEEAVDFEELDRVIEGGVRFLDNVVTMSDFPLDEIEEKVSEMRKIGLGVMGWAQMCYQMGVRYGSDESLQLGRIVMNYIDEQATKTSHELAKERGSFDAWDKSKYADPTSHADWFRGHAYELPENWEDGYPMRNHNVTTVAPTGTTSMLADTSGGIEPVYNVAYKKNVGGDIQGDTKLVEFDDVFIKTLEENEADLDHSVEEIKQICADQMDNNEFEGVEGLPVPDWMKETFVTTNDLTAREHGLMQRVFQEGVDSGISKTVNLPSDATHADVHDAYMLAVSDDELGATIKGLTVYRDQSREEQVLTTQEYSDLEVENAVEMLEELDGYSVETPDDDHN